MAKLVFDIETTARPMEEFDSVQQEYLFRDADALADPAQRETRRAEIQRQFSLWALTGQVVCIAMINADSGRGKSLYVAEDGSDMDDNAGSIEFVSCADEAQLLAEFWDAAEHYDSIITFNGRGFDVPFLYLRSAVLDVKISRKDWLGYRFQVVPHCDLLEQFTFYNVSGHLGAARRFNLDFFCKAFGVESPKSFGVTGMDIPQMVADGRGREIAEYCVRDVQATLSLHRVWQERLSAIK